MPDLVLRRLEDRVRTVSRSRRRRLGALDDEMRDAMREAQAWATEPSDVRCVSMARPSLRAARPVRAARRGARVARRRGGRAGRSKHPAQRSALAHPDQRSTDARLSLLEAYRLAVCDEAALELAGLDEMLSKPGARGRTLGAAHTLAPRRAEVD